MNDHLDRINQAFQKELSGNKAKTKKGWLWIFFALAIVIALLAFSDSGEEKNDSDKIQSPIKKIASNPIIKKTASILNVFSPPSPLEEPVNILILGIPGEGNDAPNLTDTIALAMIKPKSSEASLISVPRDLWVRIPETETFTKINSLYALGKNNGREKYGLELIKQKVQEITAQEINYYFLIDLEAVKKIVDKLGGLNLWVKKDIYDPQFPGPNHSYQIFELKAGWRYLDGETALKYVRSRHTPDGDFDRMQRQQQVIEALKQKLMGLNAVWDLPTLINVANELWSHVKTDISLSQLPQFWQTAKIISPDKVKNIIIEKENSLINSERVWLSNEEASILKPKAGLEDYSEIQKFIENNR